MSEVVVIAVFCAREGEEDTIQAALGELIAKTQGEPGCLRYALHRDTADPRRLVILERWRDQAALDAHFTMPYVSGLRAHMDRLEEPPMVVVTTPVVVGDELKGRL